MPEQPKCSALAATISRIAFNIGSEPHIRNLDDVAAEIAKVLPEINRDEVVKSIVEASTGQARAVDDIAKKIAELKGEARADLKLRAKIGELERHLKEQTVPEGTHKPGDRVTGPPTIERLRAMRDDLQKQVSKSDPALRQKVVAQIDDLTERLETGSFALPKRLESPVVSKEMDRLVFERDRLRRQVRDRIDALKPKSVWGRVAEPLNAARAVMTSLDFSAVLRQGGFITLGHPVRAAKSLGPMFRAFASEEAAFHVSQEILNRPNAPLYARSKLFLATDAAQLGAQEEAFMSRWAKNIPLVAGSARAYTTFLNKLRADSFDAMVGALARNGEATQAEASAIANYINVATGRGGEGKFQNAARGLNTVFFAPRYVASRFQLLGGQPFYGGTATTRKLVAKEYARFLVGLGVVYGLGKAAGGEIEADPRSSDFGKVRFGNTRLDPLSGLSQVAVLASRLVSGKTKSPVTGEVKPIRGDDVPYGGDDAVDVLATFIRTKLSPPVGTALDVLSRKNVVGEKVTPGSAAANLTTPMALRDVYEAIKEQGVAEGTAMGLVSIFGMSLQTWRRD